MVVAVVVQFSIYITQLLKEHKLLPFRIICSISCAQKRTSYILYTLSIHNNVGGWIDSANSKYRLNIKKNSIICNMWLYNIQSIHICEQIFTLHTTYTSKRARQIEKKLNWKYS